MAADDVYVPAAMLARTFRFLVLPRGQSLPWRGDGAHQVDVRLGIDGRETVWVDGLMVYNVTSTRLSNDIPVMLGAKKAIVKVTTGWHLLGQAKLLVDGRTIDPAPKGAGLPDTPRLEISSTPLAIRRHVLWAAIAAGLSAGLVPAVMSSGRIAKLTVLGLGAIALVGALAWDFRRRRSEK